MTTYYRADFPSGHVEVIATRSRSYVSCIVAYRSGGETRISWVGPRQNALARAASMRSPRCIRTEISDTVAEISEAEYRRLTSRPDWFG